MKYLLILALLVSGCSGGKFEDHNKYLIDFTNDARLIGKQAPDFSQTYFSNNDSTEYDAFCPSIMKRSGGPVIIYIGRKFKGLPDDTQRLIIYHEVGHCFYGLQHSSGYNIMHEHASSFAQNSFLKDNRLWFVEQIVNPL